MEDWEAVEAKMVLVEMGTEEEMADALVEAIDEAQEAQEVQEAQEDLVELVELEVQDLLGCGNHAYSPWQELVPELP